MNHDDLMAAARARGLEIQQRAHRPRQRRSSAEPGSSARAAFRADIDLRASEKSDGLHFTGYASVYERGYEMFDFFGPYTEVVTAGAAEKSLATVGLDVPLVLGHDSMRRIARTTNGSLELREDDTGLHVDAPDLDPNDADVAYIAPKLRSGLIDEMSFMFRITDGVWSPDYTEYRINAFDIHRGDVAIVGYGANPNTSGSLRSTARGDDVERARARALLDIALARR